MGTAPSVVLQLFGPHAPLSLIFPHKDTAYMNILLSWNKNTLIRHECVVPILGGHESRPIFVGWMAQQRKNYGIIGEIRIQRNKNSRFHRRRDNALKMGFGRLRPISLMFFSGGHRACSTLSPLTLKIRFYILCFMVFRRTAWNTTRTRVFLRLVLDHFAANYHLLTPKHIYYETLFSCERLFATASQAYQGWRCVSEAFAGTDACTGAGNVVGRPHLF